MKRAGAQSSGRVTRSRGKAEQTDDAPVDAQPAAAPSTAEPNNPAPLETSRHKPEIKKNNAIPSEAVTSGLKKSAKSAAASGSKSARSAAAVKSKSNSAATAKRSRGKAKRGDAEREDDDETELTEPDRPASPEANCTICMDVVENKSFTEACCHIFCYVCLRQWADTRAVCPLCQKPFTRINHSVRSPDDFETYVLDADVVLPVDPRPGARSGAHGGARVYMNSGATRATTRATLHARIEDQRRLVAQIFQLTADFRRQVYATGTMVRELRSPDNGSVLRFRDDVTWATFAGDANLQARAATWLARELGVLVGADRVAFVQHLVMDLVTRFDVSSEEFFEHLRPFLGNRTRHFAHEFDSFVRAPGQMSGAEYDACAVYDVPEEVSSNDGSDVEIIATTAATPRPSHPIHIPPLFPHPATVPGLSSFFTSRLSGFPPPPIFLFPHAMFGGVSAQEAVAGPSRAEAATRIDEEPRELPGPSYLSRPPSTPLSSASSSPWLPTMRGAIGRHADESNLSAISDCGSDIVLMGIESTSRSKSPICLSSNEEERAGPAELSSNSDSFGGRVRNKSVVRRRRRHREDVRKGDERPSGDTKPTKDKTDCKGKSSSSDDNKADKEAQRSGSHADMGKVYNRPRLWMPHRKLSSPKRLSNVDVFESDSESDNDAHHDAFLKQRSKFAEQQCSNSSRGLASSRHVARILARSSATAVDSPVSRVQESENVLSAESTRDLVNEVAQPTYNDVSAAQGVVSMPLARAMRLGRSDIIPRIVNNIPHRCKCGHLVSSFATTTDINSDRTSENSQSSDGVGGEIVVDPAVNVDEIGAADTVQDLPTACRCQPGLKNQAEISELAVAKSKENRKQQLRTRGSDSSGVEFVGVGRIDKPKRKRRRIRSYFDRPVNVISDSDDDRGTANQSQTDTVNLEHTVVDVANNDIHMALIDSLDDIPKDDRQIFEYLRDQDELALQMARAQKQRDSNCRKTEKHRSAQEVSIELSTEGDVDPSSTVPIFKKHHSGHKKSLAAAKKLLHSNGSLETQSQDTEQNQSVGPEQSQSAGLDQGHIPEPELSQILEMELSQMPEPDQGQILDAQLGQMPKSEQYFGIEPGQNQTNKPQQSQSTEPERSQNPEVGQYQGAEEQDSNRAVTEVEAEQSSLVPRQKIKEQNSTQSDHGVHFVQSSWIESQGSEKPSVRTADPKLNPNCPLNTVPFGEEEKCNKILMNSSVCDMALSSEGLISKPMPECMNEADAEAYQEDVECSRINGNCTLNDRARELAVNDASIDEIEAELRVDSEPSCPVTICKLVSSSSFDSNMLSAPMYAAELLESNASGRVSHANSLLESDLSASNTACQDEVVDSYIDCRKPNGVEMSKNGDLELGNQADADALSTELEMVRSNTFIENPKNCDGVSTVRIASQNSTTASNHDRLEQLETESSRSSGKHGEDLVHGDSDDIGTNICAREMQRRLEISANLSTTTDKILLDFISDDKRRNDAHHASHSRDFFSDDLDDSEDLKIQHSRVLNNVNNSAIFQDALLFRASLAAADRPTHCHEGVAYNRRAPLRFRRPSCSEVIALESDDSVECVEETAQRITAPGSSSADLCQPSTSTGRRGSNQLSYLALKRTAAHRQRRKRVTVQSISTSSSDDDTSCENAVRNMGQVACLSSESEDDVDVELVGEDLVGSGSKFTVDAEVMGSSERSRSGSRHAAKSRELSSALVELSDEDADIVCLDSFDVQQQNSMSIGATAHSSSNSMTTDLNRTRPNSPGSPRQDDITLLCDIALPVESTRLPNDVDTATEQNSTLVKDDGVSVTCVSSVRQSDILPVDDLDRERELDHMVEDHDKCSSASAV